MLDIYWFEQTNADVPASDGWLNVRELQRMATMRFAKRHDDWRLGRWTAKCALLIASGFSRDHDVLSRIEIPAAKSGAPEVLFDNRPMPVAISISHRDGTAACALAFSSTAVGCDLELIEPHSEAFATDYFTRDEQAVIQQASPMDRDRLLALLWSAKESALKAMREGLRLDTRSLEVDLLNLNLQQEESPAHDNQKWHPLRVKCATGTTFDGWWQQTGSLVRTLVADPSPSVPLQLRAYESYSTSNLPKAKAPQAAPSQAMERADTRRGPDYRLRRAQS